MTTELLDLDSIDSLTRRLFKEKGSVNLKELDIETYKVPEEYKITIIQPTEKTYARDIRARLEPILQEAELKGYPSNIFTAVYEATLNAYQHGNKKDDKKT